jgi:N-acetylglucosamine-6-phosphate deacetylase
LLFQNVTLVLHRRLWPDCQLRVSGGVIQEVSSDGVRLRPKRKEEVIDGKRGYLTPGFIDLHVHGALRRDAMEADPDAFDAIRRFHATGGTTALALTSVAAPAPDLLRLLRAVAPGVERDRPAFAQSQTDGARLLGIHLEGPCFAPTKAGAHRQEFIRPPDPAETRRWLEFADLITQVTLAPELPGAPALIRELRARGIIASGGHSDAWDEDARLGFQSGMEQVTHLFNAMSGARRRGPFRVAGLTEFALGEPGVRCELIADGRHVSPTLMRMAYQAKGADGICLVTDAGPGAGLPEEAAYRLGDLDCVVRDRVGMTADGAALAGSAATMIECVRNMVQLADVPLPEAVRMATWNPARALGLDRRRGWHPLWGSLSAGAPADLALLSPELEVMTVCIGGKLVHQK